ncbi:MAG: hypothetical protein JRI97_04700 [Deltaproteobacteria bacterium]|nr:hypothetical protein [Deltaproteobacteria bacterium]
MEAPDVRLLEGFFTLLCVFLAAWGVSVEISRLAGLTLPRCGILFAVLFVPAAAVTFRLFYDREVPAGLRDYRFAAALAGLAAFGAWLFAMRVQVMIAGADHFSYLGHVAYHLRHPGTPMGFGWAGYFTTHPGHVSPYFIPYTWEYFHVLASLWTGASLSRVSLSVLPAFFTAVSPLPLYVLLRRFGTGPLAALALALSTLGLLWLDARDFTTYGGMFFHRMYEVKGVLFAVGLPMLCCACLRYLQRPGAAAAFFLLAAGAGFSFMGRNTPVLFIPAAALLCLAHGLVYRRVRRALACFLLACAFPAAMLGATKLFAGPVSTYVFVRTANTIYEYGVRNTSAPPFDLSFFPDGPGTIYPFVLLFLLTGMAGLVLQRNRARLWFFWTLAWAAVFINPLTYHAFGGLFPEYSQVYDRFFFTFPAYLTPAMAVCFPLRLRGAWKLLALASLGLAILWAANMDAAYSKKLEIVRQNRWKDSIHGQFTDQEQQALPFGQDAVVLAPMLVIHEMSALDPGWRYVANRGFWLPDRLPGRGELVLDILEAQAHLDHRPEGRYPDSLKRVLDAVKPDVVAATRKALEIKDIKEILEKRGYEEVPTPGSAVFFYKDRERAEAPEGGAG